MVRRAIAAAVLAVFLFAAPAWGRQVVWTALENRGEIAKVDVSDGRVLKRFDTEGGGPHNITVAPDGSVVASLWADDRIVIVRDGEVTFVELGGHPHDPKIARNMIVVTNTATERVQLVKLDGTFIRRILLKADPHDVAIDPKERHAWATLDGNDDLAVVDLLDRSADVRYVDTDGSPHDLLFAPDGNLWVTDWKGALSVFDTPRGRLIRRIPLGEEAHHLAFTKDGRFCWITDHGSSTVFVVRVRTIHVVDRISFPGEPHHVAITANGRLAVVADHENGRLLVYRVSTHRLVREIHVGSGPHGVWAAP